MSAVLSASLRQPLPLAMREHGALLLRAIGGVLRSAHDGELPLFARTLGLPQAGLLQMVRSCFPTLDYEESIPERKYAVLMNDAPVLFRDVLAMLWARRTPDADPQHADWLARAFAAASLGRRFLWQDMGLTGREDVAALLKQFFEPLYRRNTSDMKWKSFLFLELGSVQPPAGPHGASYAGAGFAGAGYAGAGYAPATGISAA